MKEFECTKCHGKNVNRCSCYRNDGRCNGTREIDVCNCNGDESKCDFYPEKRTHKPISVKDSKLKIKAKSAGTVVHGTYDCKTFTNPKNVTDFLNERSIPKENIISITATDNVILLVFIW